MHCKFWWPILCCISKCNSVIEKANIFMCCVSLPYRSSDYQAWGSVLMSEGCYGKQRTELWAQPWGPGENRPEVWCWVGSSTGELDPVTVWGRPGATGTWQTELPEMAYEWNSMYEIWMIIILLFFFVFHLQYLKHIKFPFSSSI